MKLLQLMIEYERQENLEFGYTRTIWSTVPNGLVYLASYMVDKTSKDKKEDINNLLVY